MYDLVIKHGLLITAQGTRRADLAVDGARIAAIGRGPEGMSAKLGG